ncbi:MAG: GNAT family N-acetyltransferase, partial [Myxococcales bacterium]|nr:GNAT family N-acetyltransferase [Myxococcales bacterium]
MTQILQLRAASDAIALECVGVVGDAYLDPEGLIRSAMGRNSHVALDRVGRHLRGFLFFSIDDEILLRGRRHRIPYLGLIAVHPEHRNRGVASKLLERFRAYVRLNIGNATHTWAITATPAFY